MALPDRGVHFMFADLASTRGREHKFIRVRELATLHTLSRCYNSKQLGREKTVPLGLRL